MVSREQHAEDGYATEHIERRQPLPYRPDIDGLRALAVGAVLLYHAGIPGFEGGFIGVDVFFVISGYLITQLLLAARRDTGRLDWRGFYLRRARRILPALLTVCALCALVGVWLLFPWDLPALGKYLAATPLLLGNVVPWRTGANYFDSQSSYVALTHLWSIAVEEQFYLVYPAALALLLRAPRRWLQGLLTLLALVSFALCVIGSYRLPLPNYFLTPSRAWELLAGCILAAASSRPLSRTAASLLSALGLVVIGACIGGLSPLQRYPGLFTLPPVLACMALLRAGASPSPVRAWLGIRPLVFTGRISYSLYLWHLPVLQFLGYWLLLPPSTGARFAQLGLVYALATASWYVVENPVRHRRVLADNRRFVGSMLLANAALLAVGVSLWKSDGWPGRFSQPLTPPVAEWATTIMSAGGCLSRSVVQVARGELCSVGPQTESAPRALLWGDSHAMALLPAYEQLAREHGVRLYLALKVACRPLLGISNRRDDVEHRNGCARFNEATVRAMQRLQPQRVILNAHWVDHAADVLPDGGAVAGGVGGIGAALRRTLAAVPAGAPVCLVLDVPSYPQSVPHAVNMAARRGVGLGFLARSRDQAQQEFAEVEAQFRDGAAGTGLRTVDPKRLLCPDASCRFEDHGTLLYSDKHHLSRAGAQRVQPELAACFAAAAPSLRRSAPPAQ